MTGEVLPNAKCDFSLSEEPMPARRMMLGEILLYSEPCLPFGLNFGLLALTFIHRKKKNTARSCLIAAAGFAAAMLLSVALQMTEFARLWSFCYIVGYCGLTVVLCKLLFRCSVRECLFNYFVLQSFLDDSMMLAKAIQSVFFKDLMSGDKSYMLSYGAVLVLGLPVVFLFVKKKLRPLMDMTEQMKFWNYIWIVPIAFYFVYRLGISPEYITPDVIWEQADLQVPLLWAVATCLSNLLIIGMMIDVVKHVEDREKMDSLNQRLLMQKEQYEKLSDSIEETRIMRHNMRHQMQGIAGYADKGDLEGVKTYLQGYLEMLNLEDDMPLCQNHAVDSILHYYRQAARKKEIILSLDVKTFAELPCSVSDVCIVLGNLLQNALEACERQPEGARFIDVKIGTGNQNMVLIQVVNSCGEGTVKRGEQLLSSKRNNKDTGFGITSIQKIAAKYNGVATFEREKGMFTARVMLNKRI